MPLKNKASFLTIGEAARRTGVATSTLRFYESRGLIESIRVSGNHRRYHRATLRKVSIIRVAQTLGLSLNEISNAFDSLPDQRTPTRADWVKLSRIWGKQLDQRIAALEDLRDKLGGCIGCGCLSMQRCSLYNAGDTASSLGTGPQYLLGNPGKRSSV
ncbi:MAG: redox-sensitive transcriptional activator SoxR [Pseudomonadota bacterium]